MTEWMQFVITKKKDRAHVFQQDPNDKSVLYSLCLRWQVRKVRNTGFSALEKADQDRPRCKLCEKRVEERRWKDTENAHGDRRSGTGSNASSGAGQ